MAQPGSRQLSSILECVGGGGGGGFSLAAHYLPCCDYIIVRPLQFNYLSYELFWRKKSCQTPKKKKKKVIFGV